MHWRPHTDQPPADSKPFTALLATIGDDGEPYLLSGLYCWKQGEWRQEDDNHKPRPEQYWWLPEDEIVATLGKKKTATPESET